MARNLDSVLDQLRGAGLILDGIEVGRMMRTRVEGSRERRGWYSLHELHTPGGDAIIVGSYGVWQGNSNNVQKIEIEKGAISTEQRDALRRRLTEDRKRADALRQVENDKAAAMAARSWAQLDPTGESAYLVRKGVGAYGVRFAKSGAIAVPLLDVAGKVHGLQLIRSHAEAQAQQRPEKEFWPRGVAKKGHFHLIGMPGSVLLIVEGYATGATVHAATGLPVAVAFDANNLGPVAAALRKRYKRTRILFCADDDAFTEGNPGVTAASTAAVEVGGAFVKPVFADEAERQAKHERRGTKLSDFNDLHQLEGLHPVRVQIEQRLEALGWDTVPKRDARPPTTGGEGSEQLRPIESVEHLLERYALVYGQSGTVFDRWEHCLLSLSDMRDACMSKAIHRAWSESPDRDIVRVREVGFDPAGDDPAIKCNLWAGWPTEPKPGSCDKLLELLRYMCSAESKSAELYAWVERWLAYPIQHPGAKMKTTLVLHGPQGTGKNLFFEAIMGIYGQYGRTIDQSAIEDRFNDWASRKLFLIADEVVARADLYHVKNKLKAFITGEWIRINPKNFAAYDERNHVNMVFLSNEAMPVVLEQDDRRHTVIWTPEQLPEEFYKSVLAELAGGGVAALHAHLLSIDLGEFGPGTRPPFTNAKAELVNLGLDSTTRFYLALEAGEIGFAKLEPALSEDVYDLYKLWCSRVGVRPAPMSRLVNALQRKHGVTTARKRWQQAGAERGPHTVMLLGEAMPPGENERAWLGASIMRFRSASGEYRGTHGG
jgi:putative DNA primase/helicase